MKKLVLVALAMGGLATAPACTPASEGSYLDVGWNMTTAHGPNDCFNVADVRVTSQSATGGDTFLDYFDCGNGSGVTSLLPLDDYDVTLDFLDSAGNIVDVSDELAEVLLDLDGEIVVIPTFTAEPVGTFSLTWELQDAVGPVNCLAGDSVSLLSTVVNSSSSYEDIWSCSALAGTTADTPIGDFDVDVLLEDSLGDPLSQTEVFAADILFDGEDVALGHVIFNVN